MIGLILLAASVEELWHEEQRGAGMKQQFRCEGLVDGARVVWGLERSE